MTLTANQREILRVLTELPVGTAALPSYVWWNVHVEMDHTQIVKEFEAMLPTGLVRHDAPYWTLTNEGRQIGQES